VVGISKLDDAKDSRESATSLDCARGRGDSSGL
jgi:hypothetical protein